MNNAKRILMAGCVALIGMLGGLTVTSCATTQTLNYSYPIPSEQDIGRLILEWDALEKKKGKIDLEFTAQYAKALKALSDAIAEGERWRARAESK
jgi:hypothetical protein